AQRGENERRRAGERILPGEPGAERALIHVEIEVERILSEQRNEDAEQDERRRQGERGDDDEFRRAADSSAVCRQAEKLAQPRWGEGRADRGSRALRPVQPAHT